MDRSHHPVLAVISNCYSEPKGRFPRVTHPCATRPEGLVRLACIRHAASVRSEPESNSQVDVRSHPAGIREARPASLGAVPAQNIQTGVFAYLRHTNGLAVYQSTLNPEAPGDRAAAHMSLHLKPTMSKSRRASSPGSIGSGHRLYRLRRGAKRWPTPWGPPPLL